MVAIGTLKLKPEVIQAQKVKELLQMTIPSIDYSLGYQAKPTLRSNVMGGSSISVPSNVTARDRYISQSITELLRRTIVD